MIEALRAAVAMVPPGVWAILVGLWLIIGGAWDATHARQMQEDRLRGWPGIWGSVFPAEWLAQKERGLRSPLDRLVLQVIAVVCVIAGIVIILLFGLPNL